MRLIDADTFSDEMRNRQNAAYELMQHSEKGSETNIRMDSAYAAFIECALTLDKTPTIDIVLCNECKYYRLAKNKANGECQRQYATFYPYDYCSYGERRSENV